MKKAVWAVCAFLSFGVTSAFSQDGGYVLKPGEGEILGPDRIIKASPESGTQGGVMVVDHLEPGFTTGRHIHTDADEFFYVISGTGNAF